MDNDLDTTIGDKHCLVALEIVIFVQIVTFLVYSVMVGRGGCSASATALTPSAELEKGTSLTNSHWIEKF